MEVRLLKAEEIECRVATVTTNGNSTKCSLLLYKDARVDMRLLDETFGQMNWKRSHEIIEGNLYCTISIWDSEKKEWVSKQDVGTESMTEKEKGQASDSFKRAGFNWGIGRELYTAPVIRITLESKEIANKNGKSTTYAKFFVKEIGYNESREIIRLVIVDESGRVRYSLDSKEQPIKVEKQQENPLKDVALSDIKNASNVDALRVAWESYQSLQGEQWFIDAKNNRLREFGYGRKSA